MPVPLHICAKDIFALFGRRPCRARVNWRGLIAQGIEYVIPHRRLRSSSPIEYVVETSARARNQSALADPRIDLWQREMLQAARRRGLRLSSRSRRRRDNPKGRADLDKKGRLSTRSLTDRLFRAAGMFRSWQDVVS